MQRSRIGRNTTARSNIPKDFSAMNGNKDWEQTVMDNARFINLKQIIKTPGYHTLKIWMIDQGFVIEKIVVDTGGVRASYLGPPESYEFFKK